MHKVYDKLYQNDLVCMVFKISICETNADRNYAALTKIITAGLFFFYKKCE